MPLFYQVTDADKKIVNYPLSNQYAPIRILVAYWSISNWISAIEAYSLLLTHLNFFSIICIRPGHLNQFFPTVVLLFVFISIFICVFLVSSVIIHDYILFFSIFCDLPRFCSKSSFLFPSFPSFFSSVPDLLPPLGGLGAKYFPNYFSVKHFQPR